MKKTSGARRSALSIAGVIGCLGLLASTAFAGGEAGPISLRDQGFFWVGTRTKPVEVPRPGGAAPATGTGIEGQMYVGFQLVAKKKHPYPLVLVVSKTSDWVLGWFPVKGSAEATAADEIRFLIEAGRKEGNLDQTESEILGNVFRLDNRRVAGIMTPAADIACLDVSQPREANMKALQNRTVSRFLVCKGGIANALGFVESRELLQDLLNGGSLDFGKLSPAPPHYVPGTLSLIGLLEFFKANQTQTALVANEFGVTEGLVTLSDLMGTVVGDVLSGAAESPLALQRADGSWLLDGLLAIDEMKDILGVKELPEEDLGNFHTVGGFIVVHLGRIPKKTESFDWGGWHFEIMDMEKNRVDEVLATQIKA